MCFMKMFYFLSNIEYEIHVSDAYSDNVHPEEIQVGVGGCLRGWEGCCIQYYCVDFVCNTTMSAILYQFLYFII